MHILSFLLFFIYLISIHSVPAFAEDYKWIPYNKNDDIFEVRFPSNYESISSKVHIGQNRVAFAEQLSATIDTENGLENAKSYSVEVVQTLGNPAQEIQERVHDYIQRYLDSFVPFEGALIERNDFRDNKGLYTTDLHLTYQDPKHGTRHVKSRIYISEIMTATQSVIGKESAIYTYRSRDFLEAMKMYDGYQKTEVPVAESWKKYTSPLGIFTVSLPPVDGLYVKKEPQIHNSERSEVILSTIHDPALRQDLTYNVFGYKFKADLDYSSAITVLLKRHLNKQNIKLSQNAFKRPKEGVIDLIYEANPSALNNFSSYGRIRAQYDGPHMVVNEIFGPESLIASNFTKVLINHVDLHP